MGGLSKLLGRKKEPTPAQTQTPAAGMQTMASLVGNQGMISMMNAQRSPGGGTRPFGDWVNQELEQSILSRMPSNRATAQPAPEQQAAPAQASVQEQAREMAEMQQEPEMARSSLSDLYARLKASKRGGLHIHGGNSQLYTAVMDALGSINTAMKQTFTRDIKSNMQMLIDMEHQYQELISACAAYTKRDPGTQAGKIRKDLVTQIQSRASTDLVALSAVRTDFCALPAEQQSGKGWNELLDQSRTIRLSVKDFSQLGKAEGGAASEVYRLTDSNATVKNAAGEPMELGEMHFFKPEDEFDMTQKETAAQVVEGVLKRYPKLSKKEQDAIRQWAMAGGEGTVPTGLSELGKTALASIQDNLNGMKTTTKTLMPLLGLDQDEKVNMTRRNVATSRVAALLGLGHLVAKSETAELYDEATGATIRGNLMGKAQGDMSAASFSMGIRDKDKSTGRKITDSKEIEVNATGGFQRDLCNLQVLDVICGQMDRHAGNFFVSLNENGELAGLQGIDNDAAFGLNEEVTSAKDFQRHDRAIYDMDTGEMTLPYMDENLAERLTQLDPDMIRFALKDLLKDAEIEAVIKRLERTQTAVKKTRKDHPERFLSDDQWNDDTAQDMINQAWNKYGEFWEGDAKTSMENAGKTVGQENYFGGLMAKTVKIYCQQSNYGRGEAPQLKRWKEKHQEN